MKPRSVAILGTVVLAGVAGCSAQGLRDALGGAGRGASQWGAQQQAVQPAPQAARYYKGTYVSGLNRICIYSTVNGDENITIPAAKICPLN